MRVQADTRHLQLNPGGSGEVHLDVVNTSEVIDGVSARIVGLEPALFTARPSLLPLFPEATGRLTLTVGIPPTFPAGTHPVTVEVASNAGAAELQHVDLDLMVAPRRRLEVRTRPAVLRVRRKGRFSVEVENTGNVPLDVTLSAVDPDRRLKFAFSAQTLTVQPGTTGTVALTTSGPRVLFGHDLDRPLTVHVTGEDIDEATPAILRQRPVIPRGLLTALILLAIIGLWAAAFLVGLQKVFATDPLTKSAPASFFVAAPANGLAAAATADGVLAKQGNLPPGVGGVIAGTVSAASTGDGLGRIVVEALRPTKQGLKLVTSAATQGDGTYLLVGLFPGNYLLRFSAPGYRTTWYPSAAAQSGAKQVNAVSQQVVKGIDTTVAGLPASISGQVDPGDTLTPVKTTVTVRPLQGNATAKPLATATTDAQGNYTLKNLPAPQQYELSFTAPGYQPTTLAERVTGGQNRLEPTVRLSAGDGTIAGTVTDGHAGLGGVTVTSTVNGHDITTATPTLGAVGRFVLPNLPTPATYILTFVKQNYAAQTVVVDLGPGQTRTDLLVTLVGGTGSVSGQLVDTSGNGLGGAAVTVGGTAAPEATTTLTTGKVGLFAISGLPSPGSYTLTFTLPGYAPQTVPVVLDSGQPAPTVTVTLSRGLGSIAGRVLDGNGRPVVGATVSVTDGKTVLAVQSVDAKDATQAGGYLVPDLAPGSYAVTVSLSGYVSQTALVRVVAGQQEAQDLTLVAAG